MIWLFVGFVCFLLVLGAFLTGNPWKFTLSSLVVIGAVSFVVVIGVIVWIALGGYS